MGSSVFYPNCPRCGKLGLAEYRGCSEGAYEVFTCLHCAFGFDWETRLDKEKSIPENPVYIETFEKTEAHFKLGIAYNNGSSHGCSIVEDVREEKAIETFKKLIANPEVDADRCYLSKWDDEKKEVVYLVNHPNVISNENLEECRTPEQAARYSNFEEQFHTKIN